MAAGASYRNPIARTMGRLMKIPENTHIKRITKIMAMLLTGWIDRIPQELLGSIRAHGNPAGRKPLGRKVSGLRGFPQASDAAGYSPSARTTGRLMAQPVMQHAMRTSAMMASMRSAEASRPLAGS